jgi:hypothetical protein
MSPSCDRKAERRGTCPARSVTNTWIFVVEAPEEDLPPPPFAGKKETDPVSETLWVFGLTQWTLSKRSILLGDFLLSMK